MLVSEQHPSHSHLICTFGDISFLSMVMTSLAPMGTEPACGIYPRNSDGSQRFQWQDPGAVPAIVPVPFAPNRLGLLGEDRYWPRKFTEGQRVNLLDFNRPYIDVLRAVWNDLDDDEKDVPEGFDKQDATNDEQKALDEAEEILTEDSCVARIFMRGRWHLGSSEMLETYHKQAEDVEGFCGHVNLENLQGLNAALLETEPLALLEENTRKGEFRQSRGIMNSGQLYAALQEDVSWYRFMIVLLRLTSSSALRWRHLGTL